MEDEKLMAPELLEASRYLLKEQLAPPELLGALRYLLIENERLRSELGQTMGVVRAMLRA